MLDKWSDNSDKGTKIYYMWTLVSNKNGLVKKLIK